MTAREDRDQAGSKPVRALFALLLVWIVYLTLQPFEWDLAPADVAARLGEGLRSLRPQRLMAHAAWMVAFGFSLGLASRARRTRNLSAILLFCLVLELLQCFVAGRHPRVGDFGLRLLAGSVGLLSFHLIHSRRDLRTLLGSRGPGIARCAVFVVPVLFGIATANLLRRSSLASWDPGFSLVLGNEQTWNRPWEGCIHGLAFYGNALAEEEARQLAALPFSEEGLERRRALGAVALFARDGEGSLFADRIGEIVLRRIPPHDEGARAPDGALCLERSVRVSSAEPPRRLTRALARGSAFTVELACSTDAPEQTGPARIVTSSSDAFHRNFTIGQAGPALRLRVRSTENEQNGNRNEASWAGVFARDVPRHLVVTYTRGAARLILDGARGALPSSFLSRTTDPERHLLTFPWAASLLIWIPAGILTAFGWRNRLPWRRRIVGGLALAGSLLAVDVLAAGAVGVAVDPTHALHALLFVPLGDLLAGRAGIAAPLPSGISSDSG